MKFDETRVYTSLTADVVQVGSKGYVADNLTTLKEKVTGNKGADIIAGICTESAMNRFIPASGLEYNLFYLVAEPKEKVHRPYRNTNEMTEDFMHKCYNSVKALGTLFKPHIWLKNKESGNSYQITAFDDECVYVLGWYNMSEIFTEYTYLDGSPCGVEE